MYNYFCYNSGISILDLKYVNYETDRTDGFAIVIVIHNDDKFHLYKSLSRPHYLLPLITDGRILNV